MTGGAYYIGFEELVRVIGLEAATNLLALHGGRKIYVRQKLPDDNFIIAAIGRQAGDKLAEHIATGVGGMAVEFPTASAAGFTQYRQQLRRLASDPSQSERDIADMLRISGRTVRRMRARLRDEDRAGASKIAAE